MIRNTLDWSNLSSAEVSDALRACGRHFQAMDAGIKPIAPDMRMAGPAFTVRCYPGATWAIEKAVETAQPGDVLVVDGGGISDIILMGGLMSQRAFQRGLAGVIIDGAVRDIDEVIGLGFPMFSRHISPRAGTFAEIGEWQVTICCGRMPVSPGDWIVADRIGVVAIPPDLCERAWKQAMQIHQRESDIAGHLRNGKSLVDAATAVKAG